MICMICAVTQHLIFGRSYPIISFPKHSNQMCGDWQVIFKNCWRAPFGQYRHCCNEETAYVLTAHTHMCCSCMLSASSGDSAVLTWSSPLLFHTANKGVTCQRGPWGQGCNKANEDASSRLQRNCRTRSRPLCMKESVHIANRTAILQRQCTRLVLGWWPGTWIWEDS